MTLKASAHCTTPSRTTQQLVLWRMRDIIMPERSPIARLTCGDLARRIFTTGRRPRSRICYDIKVKCACASRGAQRFCSCCVRCAKFFFPRQFRTPSTNSFAYSQSELHDMNSHDLRLRNKSTHARGLVIFIAVRKRGKNTRKMHTTKFTCKYCSVGLYCALIHSLRPL